MRFNKLNPFRIVRWFRKKRDRELEMAVYEDTQRFLPDIPCGKVVRVHDGDTLTIAARVCLEGKSSMKLYRFNVRLRGTNSPEISSKYPAEKLLAIEARDALRNIIMGKIVTLEGTSYDKYGRLLADVKTQEGLNVGQWMIENQYAISYDGGKKYIPNEWTDIPLN
jgi:endonuclease YncB( thermonuclease family)